MNDICFYEAFEEEAAELQRLLPANITAIYTDKTVQESEHAAPLAPLISIRTQSRVPLSWGTQLDAILSRSTGYDHLLAYAAQVRRPQLALGYLPLYCHRAVAEHAMLMWMALLRRLPRQLRQFHDFHRDGLTGNECQGRTLAVVGVGNIGYEVWKLGRALEMKVLGVDVNRKHVDVDYVTVEEALSKADVMVCAMDLNRGNRGYFDQVKLRQLKPGAIFVNVSRGELSPSSVLLDELIRGHLGGVGLDVFDHEAELAVSLRHHAASDDAEANAAIALSQRDDCLCTPHNAFNSAEAVVRKSEHSVQQIIAYQERKKFIWSPPVRSNDGSYPTMQ